MKISQNNKLIVSCILLISINSYLCLAEMRNIRTSSRIKQPDQSFFTMQGWKVVSNTKGIKPVAHEELLEIIDQQEKQDTNDLVNRFRQFPKEQKLETAAYCLKENKHVSQILLKICSEEPLHDKCLVPYIAEIMPKLKDNDLMMAARAASIIPDVNLVEPLINYAAKSDYTTSFVGGSGRFAKPVEWSVFKEAGLAIIKITDDRMGTIDLTKPKETVIQEWRDIWPYVKKEMQDEIEEKRKAIHPVAHLEILAIFAQAEGIIDKSEYTEVLKNYNLNDKLETIVYSLEQGLYPDCLRYMNTLQDKRLVPFIAKAIKEYEGEKLWSALQLAVGNPDPNLLPYLMKYAFDNDYVKTYRYGTENEQFYYVSVFSSAAYAISEITEGKIGTQKYRYFREAITEDQKQAMIQQWLKIYEETLKQDYEPSKLILPSTPVEPNKPVNKSPNDKIVP